MRTEKKAFEGGLASRHHKSIKNNGLRRAKPSTGGLVRTTHVREIRLSLIIGGTAPDVIYYIKHSLCLYFVELILRSVTYHLGIHEQAHFRPWKCSKSS